MLSAGPELLAIPGPSVMPSRVMREFSRPMVDIYAGELVEITDEIERILPAVAGSSGHLFIAIGNGHAAWEMALTNTLSKDDRVLVVNCGVFAAVWGEMAAFMGVEVDRIDAEPGRASDPAEVGRVLAADREHTIKAVLTVQGDTASSARNDIPAIRRAIDEVNHPALLMVDTIASLGCEPFEMDAWGVDLVVAASQKGMMTPPGLGFNIVGERALAASARADLRTYYWDWTSRRDRSVYYKRFCGTPPVSHLFALREALRMIDEEGLAARYARHRVLAGAVHAAVEAWAASTDLRLNIADPAERCQSVTTITTGSVDAEAIRRICCERLGAVLGIGFADSSFRIGHMGHVNAPSVLAAVGAVETALHELGECIDQSGVAAATHHLAGVSAR